MTVSGSVQERIAQIARLQRGRVARRQLLAVGISTSTVQWLVSQQRLIRRLRGVFAVGHTAPIELERDTEALLSVRDGAALSHLSAAGLWGLCAPGGMVEIVIGAGRSSRTPGVCVHRSRTPQVNVPFATWSIDFYWPQARFAIETDSRRFHSTRYRYERDRRKDTELRRARIDVMRITRRTVLHAPHALIADTTRELTRRGL